MHRLGREFERSIYLPHFAAEITVPCKVMGAKRELAKLKQVAESARACSHCSRYEKKRRPSQFWGVYAFGCTSYQPLSELCITSQWTSSKRDVIYSEYSLHALLSQVADHVTAAEDAAEA